jgi:glycosyltransferase involved in cell wall biosynthesis
MKIAVVIATYDRPDGKTKNYLIRALNSVYLQTHKDYHVYLIGDAIPHVNEYIDIVEHFPQVTFVNLDKSIEREKYLWGSYELWAAGGLTPRLTGIDMALKDGYEYICSLDHDDFWLSNHLFEINKVIEQYHPMFICTVSTYPNTKLPNIMLDGDVVEWNVTGGCCCNSASCVKYSDTELRTRDRFAEEGILSPPDADLWWRLGEEMKIKGQKGYLIKKLTAHHDEEGYTMKVSKRKI